MARVFEFGKRAEPRILCANDSDPADRHTHAFLRWCVLSLVEGSMNARQFTVKQDWGDRASQFCWLTLQLEVQVLSIPIR